MKQADVRTLTITLLAAAALLVLNGAGRAQQKFPDLYNLGPLGGKASVARGEFPDAGTCGLCVVELFKGGPAEKAGLKVGDTIYGAGKVFEQDAYLELGYAIAAAEAKNPAHCELMLKRGDENLKLTAVLAHFADADDRTRAILQAACKWLAAQQDSEGAFRSTLSPEVSQVVLTSLAGMAWLAAGNKPHEGAYAANIVKAAVFVSEFVGEQKHYRKLQGKNNDQTNWSLGYGGVFLAHVAKAADEKWLKRSELKRIDSKLKWIRDRILKQAEPDGGFAAGPGGANILDYVHLEVMSNFCLAALGCIRQAGVDVDAEKVEPLLAYVEKCQGEDGGIHYSHDKLWGTDVGRTAGAMNAFAALGVTSRDSYARMKSYLDKNYQHAFSGHSTPTMHQLSVAIAARREGMLDKYWAAQDREFTMVRNPDHTFAYRPTADTLRMGMNLDRDLGAAWTTAHWVIVLGLKQGGSSLWVAKP
ncbi:MAG: hypothetical protein IT464_16495 [Planctomycetes bacterium]|nr:hypothetical protein [Planctomycetota bacterium]